MWFDELTEKPKAIQSKFIPPYRKEKGKLKNNLSFLCTRCHTSGVYLIRDTATGKVIYVGYSASNLYKTILRHFQEWNDRQQRRYVYSKTGYTVRVILTTKARAALLEKYLIVKMQPRDNKEKYDGYLTKAQTEKAAQIVQETKIVPIEELEEPPF